MNSLYIDRKREMNFSLNILNNKLRKQSRGIMKAKEENWKKRLDRKVIEEDG